MEAPGCQVGGDQHVPAFFLEFLQGLLACALAQAAVKRRREHIALVQLGREMLGRVLAGHKNQHPFPAVVLDQLAQKLCAALVIDFEHALLDHRRIGRHRGHIDPLGLLQHLLGQRFDGGGKSG